jgi:hypothetical protein
MGLIVKKFSLFVTPRGLMIVMILLFVFNRSLKFLNFILIHLEYNEAPIHEIVINIILIVFIVFSYANCFSRCSENDDVAI